MQTTEINLKSEITKELADFSGTEGVAGFAFFTKDKFRLSATPKEQFLVFGSNEVSDLGVSLSTQKISIVSDDYTQFVNSSLPLFTDCLRKHQKLVQTINDTDEDRKYYRIGQELEGFIADADQPALQDDCFWALIIEELTVGYEEFAVA